MFRNIVFFFFTSTLLIVSQSIESLTLEEIYSTNHFDENKIENIQWEPNSKSFTYTKLNSLTNLQEIYKHDISGGTDQLLLSGNELIYNATVIKMSDYQWTKDGKYILIQGPSESIWRHSTQSPYYLFNVEQKKVTPLSNQSKSLRNVKLSPDGKLVGFVRDHNIYIADLLTGKETQVTTDGTNNILNGEFDWVYEEEFGLADGWRWSPDSKKIAYWKFDQTRVKEFHLIDEMPVYNKVYNLKYTKVGEQNAIVNVYVADLIKKKNVQMDTGLNDDIYLPRIFWTNSSEKLAIVKLNRKQDNLQMIMANSTNGNSEVIITDSDPCWVDVHEDITFLTSSDQIIWTSEKSGFLHAYLYDYEGNLINQITTGEWEITKLSGVDEKTNLLYFYGKKESTIEQNIYRVNLNSTNMEKISLENGWHQPIFSPDFNYYIDYFSNVNTPTKTILHKSDGTEIRILNDGNIPSIKKHNLVYPEFMTVTTSDNVELNAYMMKPADFDESKKYKVLVFGYGGPGSQQVMNKWGNYRTYWHQYMTEQDYIIFCLDNRGTGGRGKEFKNLSYGDLSKWSVNDQIEGAKYLASLPYVDKNRIGFWGWSGGGYLTIALLTKAADYFSTGVAVAPVTDFFTYDAIFAERVMNLPVNNPEGYSKSNLQNYVNLLKGKLLIIHGMGDDNVHYQNTIQFVDKCVDQNKQLDIFLYPNKNHSISGGNTRLHLFTKITEYFNQYL